MWIATAIANFGVAPCKQGNRLIEVELWPALFAEIEGFLIPICRAPNISSIDKEVLSLNPNLKLLNPTNLKRSSL